MSQSTENWRFGEKKVKKYVVNGREANYEINCSLTFKKYPLVVSREVHENGSPLRYITVKLQERKDVLTAKNLAAGVFRKQKNDVS